jgi:hypothetical protein
MALKERVEDYTGTFSDVAALNAWLIESARRHIDISPAGKLMQYTTKVTTTLPDPAECRVLEVYWEGVRCRRGDLSIEDQYRDSGSLNYATLEDPVYLFENGAITVIRGSAVAPTVATYARTIPYPTSISCTSDMVISGVPREITDLVVLDVVLRALHVILGELTDKYTALSTRLDTEEDIELSQAKMNEIQLKIVDYQAKVKTVQFIYQNSLMLYLGRTGAPEGAQS